MGELKKLFLGLSLFFATTVSAEITINEVMPCNISSYMDKESTFNYSGYTEFYNSGTSSVDLKGYKIVHEKRTSKSVYSLKWEWKIAESVVVPAGGYKLIFFDEVEKAGHSKYKLDSDGGKLYLYDASGKMVSQLTYPAMYTHISYGPDGYMEPSPKKKNTLAVSNISLRCVEPTFSGATPGVQSGSITLSIVSTTPNSTIRYTTDGTEPTEENGKTYKSALTIAENTVIRARAYADGYLSSSILTGSFLYLDDGHRECGGKFTVPIVSLVVDEDYHFKSDSFGICVKGKNGAPIVSASCLGTGTANFMQDWDRPVNFEYIVNGKQVLTHEAEVGVMGGCSRGYNVKSLKIKAGKKMGAGKEILDYPFFAEKSTNKYKSLHLRNGGNAYDYQWVRCRDGYMQSLAKAMNIDYQAYQPVAYFINGKYKGLMGLRERTSDDYVESNYGVDGDDIDMMKLTNSFGVEVTAGDADAYNALISFLQTADPSSSTYYSQAAQFMDMDEYIDYQIMEQFVVNTDWPGNNCKLWREKDNGRFRWILFDTDFGLGLYGAYGPNYCDVAMNSLEWCTSTGSKINWANGTKQSDGEYEYDNEAVWKTIMFRRLMQNDVFKQKFLNRNLIHLGTTFTADRVDNVWDSLVAVVKDEYCAAGGGNLSSLSNAKSMVQFAKDRPNYMYKYLKSFYGLGSLINLDFSSNVSSAHFMMNDELVNMSSFSGKYFAGKELKLEAIAPFGYRFSHWELGDGAVSDEVLNDNTIWNYSYTAEGQSSDDWAKASFDDSSWDEGIGKFGYASSIATYNTVLEFEDPEDKPITAYFRSQFNLVDLNSIKNLKFSMVYDDGFVLYINGKEVKRDNMEEGEITGTTPAITYKNDEELGFNIDKSSEFFKYLVRGVNTIAVEVHQDKPTSSDLTFKLNMTVNYDGGVASSMLNEPILVTTLSESKSIKAVFEKTSSCPDFPLLISEIAPSNNSESNIVDEYGNHPDWFEIYNNGNDTINLAGLYLTDNMDKPFKSQIPYGYNETKLKPGDRFVFWADGKSFRGVHHVDFKLSNSDAESEIYLFSPCDKLNPIDLVVYSPMEQNASYGREDDNSDNWVTYHSVCQGGSLIYFPTPGAANGSVYDYCDSALPTETEEVATSNVLIYPNPTTGILNIRIEDAKDIQINVYDATGRICSKTSVLGSETTLDVSDLSAGAYSLQIVSDGSVSRQTFLKK